MSGVGVKGSRPVLQGFAAMAAITLASFTPPVVAFPAAVTGLWLGWMATRVEPVDGDRDRSLVLVTAALLVIGLRSVGTVFEFPTNEHFTWMATGLLAVTALGWAWRARDVGGVDLETRRRIWPGLMVLAALVVVAVPAISRRDATWVVDVHLQHVAAAKVLSTGGNPYTDAVSTPSSAPSADDGETIDGYPYPPITLVAYALGAWLGGDPGWTTVIALGVTAGIVVWGMSARPPEVAFGVGALLIGIPWLEFLLVGGWTEPLTLSLLAVAFTLWHRRPFLSAVTLGLALASKQYLILFAPVLLTYREPGHLRRLLTAGATVVMTLLPFAIWDPISLWRSTVVRLLGVGFRPDTQSLSGFLAALGWEVELPRSVWLVAVLGIGAYLGRKASGPATLLSSLALALGAAFAVNVAFGNYWLLVAGMFGLALVLETNEEAPVADSVDE